MKALVATLILLIICAGLRAEENSEWQAPLPVGAETDLVQLNVAAGNQRGADYIQSQKRTFNVKIKPLVIDGLKPKAPDIDGLFVANPSTGFPDMLGAGLFYLIKRKDTYHIVTAKNFDRLFGPLTNREEVLPPVTLYERIFGERFADVINAAKPRKIKDAPPDTTEIAATKDGFEVKLILYNGYQRAFFAEKHLLVRTNGSVEVTKPLKVIKELGRGVNF